MEVYLLSTHVFRRSHGTQDADPVYSMTPQSDGRTTWLTTHLHLTTSMISSPSLTSHSNADCVRANADEETTANNTNLAFKGIVGVKAMAEISRAVGQSSDAKQYDVSATPLSFSVPLSVPVV